MVAYYTTSISRGGQITLPAEARRFLGVGLGDRVAVTIADGEVKVIAAPSIARELGGSLPISQRDDDPDFGKRIDAAIDEHVGDVIERLHRP